MYYNINSRTLWFSPNPLTYFNHIFQDVGKTDAQMWSSSGATAAAEHCLFVGLVSVLVASFSFFYLIDGLVKCTTSEPEKKKVSHLPTYAWITLVNIMHFRGWKTGRAFPTIWGSVQTGGGTEEEFYQFNCARLIIYLGLREGWNYDTTSPKLFVQTYLKPKSVHTSAPCLRLYCLFCLHSLL